MRLLQQILTRNDCYKKGQTIKPKGIMVHSTGANNPRLSRYVPGSDAIGHNTNGNHWDMSGVGACVHAFIGRMADGSVATVQTLPWNWRGWHCASGRNGSANNTHISFEICEDGLKDWVYFQKVYREAVELVAMLCKTYNLDPLADGVVICHSEGYKRGIASNHADVMHWFPMHGKSMDTFRADVAALLSPATDNNEEEDVIMYNKIADCPEYAQATIRKLVDAGCLSGTGTGAKDADGRPADLALTNTMVRMLVILDRAGAFHI